MSLDCFGGNSCRSDVFFGSTPGFVYRKQSDPGFVNPVWSDPIRIDPGFANALQLENFLTKIGFENFSACENIFLRICSWNNLLGCFWLGNVGTGFWKQDFGFPIKHGIRKRILSRALPGANYSFLISCFYWEIQNPDVKIQRQTSQSKTPLENLLRKTCFRES